jgi:type I restriction enzyme M protein
VLLDFSAEYDQRALALAVRAVAALPRDLITGAELAVDAQNVLVRSSGKSGDLAIAGASVMRLMSALGNVGPGIRICDPSCGTGSVLLAARQFATGDMILHGSDPNRRAAALARVILLLAGVQADIDAANVLVSPPARLRGPYDAVLSIPPFNSHPPHHLHIEGSERFRFGAPSRNADWLYAQHALSILAPDGAAVLLMTHGALFRGGSEGYVRRGLVEAEFVDAVVALPPGMVSNTAIPTALLLLRRTRAPAHRGKVLFVDVPLDALPGDRRGDLSPAMVETLADLVRKYGPIELPVRARAVTREELADSDYSLIPSRYLEPLATSERRTLHEIQADLRTAVAKEATLNSQLRDALAQLVNVTSGTDRSVAARR